jgi:RNA polymerase subunit RPABC4/transcription elongation factor Spt4
VQYALIPLFFGLITACVGKYKRSSFVIWFIVGTLLPFIGLVAALLMRSDRYDPRRECPNCNAVLGIAVQVCPRCGEDLDYPTELLPPKGYRIVDDAEESEAPTTSA